MSVVNLRIGGRDYQVACDDGEEDHLRMLADDVDDRVRSLVYRMGGNPGEAMSLLLTTLMMADELVEKDKQNISPDDALGAAGDTRMAEVEVAMAATLEEIALRIEKIADRIEIR